jgi:hypothetical protein
VCIIVQGELEVRNPVRLIWLPCDEYVKTATDRLRRLACNDCKLCKCATVQKVIVVTTCERLINPITNPKASQSPKHVTICFIQYWQYYVEMQLISL